jgi:hypothetical protein
MEKNFQQCPPWLVSPGNVEVTCSRRQYASVSVKGIVEPGSRLTTRSL